MAQDLRSVDPRALLLPPSRTTGADREKVIRQFSQFGLSTAGMKPPPAWEMEDGRFVLLDGVTRATRIAEKAPGTPFRVNVVGKIKPFPPTWPTIADTLP